MSHRLATIEAAARVVDLPHFFDRSGDLTFMQEPDHIPFRVDHVRWDMRDRGGPATYGRASHDASEIVVALSGTLEISVHDNAGDHLVALDRANLCLYLPRASSWQEHARSADAIRLTVASAPHEGSAGDTVVDPVMAAAPEARATSVDDCVVVALPPRPGASPGMTELRRGDEWPFPIRRIYYLTDVPEGSARGGHAHRELHQLLIAARGSFEVHIDDGTRSKTIRLARPGDALHLVPGIWRDLRDFSAGSICLVVASSVFDEGDYVRDYRGFRSFKGQL
jgi:WxcM-like, C-terminal